MNCPVCSETLSERERSGIEIDICPQCRGVWLDRGELEKILAREATYNDEAEARRDPGRAGQREDVGGDLDEDGRQPRKKRGFFQSLLENLGEGSD
jgi:hypothetical protein